MNDLTDAELAQLVSGERRLCAENLQQCEREGILPLIKSSDPAAEDQQQQAIYRSAVWETAHQRIVSGVLEQFSEHGLEVLVIKGSALAYSIYPDPWQRSRLDTDLFIQESDLAIAAQLLEFAGFEADAALPGRLAMAELAFYREDEFGVIHAIDLHWRLNNNWRLARAITFHSIWQNRMPLPGLSSSAFRPDHAASMLIACVHRVAHADEFAYHQTTRDKMKSDATIWAYDIHLLSSVLQDPDWKAICDLAITARLGAVVLEGLDRSRCLFESPIPDWVLDRLERAPDQILVQQFSRRIFSEWVSFRAIPGVGHKLRFLREQLFPDVTYMKMRYPGQWLAWAYAKRIASGLLDRAG